MTRWAMVACLVLAVAGCSSDDGAADSPDPSPAGDSSVITTPTTQPTDDLQPAVKAYSDAFLTGDAETAFGLLTARCQEREGEEAFGAIVDQAAELYGSPLEFESFDAEVNGDQARVTYTYSVSAINQDQEPWARENGAWHNDDC